MINDFFEICILTLALYFDYQAGFNKKDGEYSIWAESLRFMCIVIAIRLIYLLVLFVKNYFLNILLIIPLVCLFFLYKIFMRKNSNTYSKKYKKVVGGSLLAVAVASLYLNITITLNSPLYLLGIFAFAKVFLFVQDIVGIRMVEEETFLAKHRKIKQWLATHPQILKQLGKIICYLLVGLALSLLYFQYLNPAAWNFLINALKRFLMVHNNAVQLCVNIWRCRRDYNIAFFTLLTG